MSAATANDKRRREAAMPAFAEGAAAYRSCQRASANPYYFGNSGESTNFKSSQRYLWFQGWYSERLKDKFGVPHFE